MSRIEESYEMVDLMLGGIKYKKIKEGEESIDNILGEKESAYQKYFKSKLEKYGVESPNDLDEEQKKEFFDDVDAGWKGKKE